MSLEGSAPTAALSARPGLPPLGTYLRAVVALGVGSLRQALPALGFLYCYRLGMELFLAFSAEGANPFDSYDSEAFIMSGAMELVAYLPMLVLIYSPFLPLQDAILRGTRRPFFDCVRLVLERLVAFVISVIAQVALAFGPPVILVGAAAALITALPSRDEELARIALLTTLAPALLWVGIIAFFLIYALPLLLLERRGPLVSIRLSFTLVAQRFAGLFGRLFVFFCLLTLAAIALSMPQAILQVWSTAASADHPILRVASAIWSAAVSAILFPFSVAALMLLYRSSVPAGGSAVTGAGDPGAEAPQPTSPFRFE
jgi:hypothetical protein